MADDANWTSSRAREQFDLLLDQAKAKGPQDIKDYRGTFTLEFKPENSGETITEFLSKGLPEGSARKDSFTLRKES